jgi:hypothetical protein
MIGKVKLSRSGLVTSRLGFGTSRLHYIRREERRWLIDAAIDLGFFHFDTAPSYGDTLAECEIGAALGGRRDHVVIATKYGIATTYGHINNFLMCPEEIMEALEDLRAKGQVRYFGLSGGWTSIGGIEEREPRLGSILQTSEREWIAHRPPEITYGAIAASSQSFLSDTVPQNAAIDRLGYELHIVAEQVPRYTNIISLASEADVFGCPLAAIEWRIDAADISTIHSFARRFDRFWRRHSLDGIAELVWSIDRSSEGADVSHGFRIAGDIYHPGGTTRMGVNGETGVVNADLTSFAIPNLSIASTSVFPSGASANPTMMLMALTLRLATDLAGRL